MTFYIPKPGRKTEDAKDVVMLALSGTEITALHLLIVGVQAMASPDPYYGHLCRCCGKRFVQEGEAKHEAWCIVPLADLLAFV